MLVTLPLLSTLVASFAVIPVRAQKGPEMDVLRFSVVGGGIPPRPPDEILYLNEFSEWYYEWKNLPEYVLGSPDGDYIEGDANAQWASLYSFQDIELADREIEDIQIEGYVQYPNGFTEAVDIDFYGFSSVQDFVWLGSGWGTSSWDWHEVRWIDESVLEKMPELANETELNNIQLLMYNYYGDAPDIIRVDSVRLNVWFKQEQPSDPLSARLLAMLNDETHVLTDLVRTADVELLDEEGFGITQDLGFHIGYIGFNIRADQSYRRTGITYWPLKDVEFRHALVHCYNQLAIIPPIYGYIVTPVRSLVPPAQGKYYNTNVPEHPYNPGDPFTSPAGEHSTCGILKAKGYTFEDAGTAGVVDDADYWKCPDGSPLPYMKIFTPLMEVAPTSYQHAAEFVADLREVGLAATSANGDHGLKNVGRDSSEYLTDVYGYADFDVFMAFCSLGRLPTQLFSFLHTSQDCKNYPGRGNAVGVNDPTLDALVETVKFSLDTYEIETAAKTVQEMLYDPTLPNADNFAFSYMPLYSRSYFNAFSPDLEGIVKSPGYGSDNKWTFLNINWEPGTERTEGGKTVLIWTLGDAPDSFNPLYAGTKYEWEILSRIYDRLTNVNPYNHYDIPWMATDWTITETVAGMDIDFTLREGVEWQDGKPFTAYDIEFCLEFLRDYHVPRYSETWETLIDVEVADATHLTIHADETGIGLFYDYAALAAYLPPQIWDRAWASDQAVLDYDPTEAYNVAPGYTAGPHPTPTNLFGTGPFTFQYYDAVNMYADTWANRNYFMDQAEIADVKTEMFWEVGDYNRDGIVTRVDLTFVSFALGCFAGDPCYDPDADFDSNGYIGTDDLYNCAYHLLWTREYWKPEKIAPLLVQDEKTIIESWDLNQGFEKSLTGKLDDALNLLSQGNINGAIHKLQDLLTKVTNDAKHLTQEQKDDLLVATQEIIDLIE